MKLHEFTPDLLEQAIQSYLPVGYPDGVRPGLKLPDIQSVRFGGVQGVLARFFQDESRNDPVSGMRCERYTFRIGNTRYPHMKVAVQEFMERGHFYVGVDAHDDLPMNPSAPGFRGWQLLRDYNAWVKHRAERRWHYLGLPTLLALIPAIGEGSAAEKIELPQRILVVDDDQELAAAVERALTQKGFLVSRARDGQEALDRLNETETAEEPDLIVMDYMMPRLNGGEVCARLKNDSRLNRIPVLLATTTPLEMIGQHGADGFLVKPFHRQVLLQMVSHLLARARKP